MFIGTCKTLCARTFACNFGVRMKANEHMQHLRDPCHKLTLGLPHYTCGVATDIVASYKQWNIAVLQLIGFFVCTKHTSIHMCRHIRVKFKLSCTISYSKLFTEPNYPACRMVGLVDKFILNNKIHMHIESLGAFQFYMMNGALFCFDLSMQNFYIGCIRRNRKWLLLQKIRNGKQIK